MTKAKQKSEEVQVARKFLDDTGLLLNATIKTLAEFVGSVRDPKTNRHYDDIPPDVVALAASKNIGIELTAYSGNVEENRLVDFRQKVNEIVRDKLSTNFPDLRGFYISWHSKIINAPPKNSVKNFANELLEFTQDENKSKPFLTGKIRSYPEHHALPKTNPFQNWPALDGNVSLLRIRKPKNLQGYAVSVNIGGYTSIRSTSTESLTNTIEKKNKAIRKAYKENITEFWLLIHAVRNPPSSDIYPLFPDEIESLLNSEAAQRARDSSFSRVLLWDGIDSGYVDLKTGNNRPTMV